MYIKKDEKSRFDTIVSGMRYREIWNKLSNKKGLTSSGLNTMFESREEAEKLPKEEITQDDIDTFISLLLSSVFDSSAKAAEQASEDESIDLTELLEEYDDDLSEIPDKLKNNPEVIKIVNTVISSSKEEIMRNLDLEIWDHVAVGNILKELSGGALSDYIIHAVLQYSKFIAREKDELDEDTMRTEGPDIEEQEREKEYMSRPEIMADEDREFDDDFSSKYASEDLDSVGWFSVLKAGTVDYSGTCRTCKQFVRGGDVCPLKLPSPDKAPQGPNCPMRV